MFLYENTDIQKYGSFEAKLVSNMFSDFNLFICDYQNNSFKILLVLFLCNQNALYYFLTIYNL